MSVSEPSRAHEHERSPHEPARSSIDLATVLTGVALVAVLVAFSVHRAIPFSNADALLYGLISTEHLSPFYWGQDRLANLVPLLAWPVQQVRWNYLLQTSILGASFFLLIGCFALFHANRVRRVVTWPTILLSASITGVVALGLLTPPAGYTFVLEQQYATSTLAFVTGLACLGRDGHRSRIAAAALILTATLLIPSTVLLFPAVVLMYPGSGWVRRGVWAGGLSAAAFVVNSIAARAFAEASPASDAYSDFSWARIRVGFQRSANNIADSTVMWPTIAVGAVCILVLVARRRELGRSLIAAYLLCPVVGLMWIVLFSANAWVEMNIFFFRYFFVAYAAGLLLLAGAVTEVCSWLLDRADRARTASFDLRGASVVATVALVASAAVVVRTEIPALVAGERLAVTADERDVEVVVGDYWQAWPAMFAASDSGRDLLVASARAQPLRGRIMSEATTAGSIDVLCLSADVPTCIADLSATTAAAWSVVSVRSEDPLVIEVALAD